MLKMYWFLLIFILKLLPIIQGAPIDVATDPETLENIIHQGFVVTDNVNNLEEATMKDSQKLSINNNAEATTILVRVDETAEEFLQRKQKPILNNADSAIKQAVDTFTEGLKSLKNFSFNKNSPDVQNSNMNENELPATHTSVNFDQTSVESVGSEILENLGFNQNSADFRDPNINENIETTTTTLANLGQTAEEGSEFRQTLDTINSTIRKSVDTSNDGLKYLDNFSFNKNSADSQISKSYENVETTSPNLVDTSNSSLQQTAVSLKNGLKSLENLSFDQNSADSQNANINENVERTTNQGHIAEERLESQQTLDAINSAVQESVDTLNEGFKSLENLSFYENSSDFQSPNINENLETTSSANLGQTAEKSLESQQTLDAINSAVQQSVDTLNEGFKSLETLSFHENSSDSQNFNFNKNVETEASANLGQTTEESLQSKQILDTINSAVQKSDDTFTDGLKSLENLSVYKNSSDSHNSNINDDIETPTTSTNLDLTAEENSESKQIVDSFNSEVKQFGDTFNKGFKYLENLRFHQNLSDSKNVSLNEKDETTTATSANLNQTSQESLESKHILAINNSEVKEFVNGFTEGLNILENLGFQQNSNDFQNSNSKENIETTTTVNLNQFPEESGVSKTLETIYSAVNETGDNFNAGLKSLDNFSFQQNSADFQNSNINENVEATLANLDQTPEESSESSQIKANINSAVKESVNNISNGSKSFANFSFHENSTGSQHWNSNESAETTKTLDNLNQTPEKSAELKQTLDAFNSPVYKSINTFTEGLRSVDNLSFQQNSADSQNLNINENEQTTKISVLLNNTPEASVEPKTLDTNNSVVKESVDQFNEGIKSLENFNFQQNAEDFPNLNINKKFETTTVSVNLDEIPKKSVESKLLENINSAVKESVDTLNEGIMSLENFGFQQNSAVSQKSNINENIETTSANLYKTPKESNESKLLGSINSEVQQSINTVSEGIRTLNNFGLNQNSEESENLSRTETDEITTSANFDQNPTTLETVNSVEKQSAEAVHEALNALKNFDVNGSSQNSNINKNVGTTPTSANMEQNHEGNSQSETLETINLAPTHYNDIFNEGLISLKNFDIFQPQQNSQNSNNIVNVELATITLNPDLSAEESSISETIETINSTQKQSEENINEGLKTLENFSFHQNSADSQNSNIYENDETAATTISVDHTQAPIENLESNSFSEGLNAFKNYKNSETFRNGVATTNSRNLEEKYVESSEPNLFETINSEVKHTVETVNEGLNLLGSFGVSNSENSNNSNNSEVEKTTTSSSNLENKILDPKILKTLDSAVKESVDTANDGLNALNNLSLKKKSEDSQNLNNIVKQISKESFEFKSNSEDSQNLNNNVDQISKEISEFKSTLNNSIDSLNTTVNDTVDNFKQGLKKLENFSLNTNSEHSRNLNTHVETAKYLDIVDQKPEIKETSDYINSELKQSEGIFNEGVKVLDNFTNLENISTDSNSSIEEVEVAKVKEIFITTQTPIVNLFERFNQIPVNEYSLKQNEEQKENLTQNIEQTSDNNSALTQLSVTSTREEEQNLSENNEEIKNEPFAPFDIPPTQKEINIESILSPTEISILNLKESTDQTSEEIHDQTTALNSAVDLLNNGVILMKNYLNLDNSRVIETTDSSFEEILKTTEAPVLNLFESLCLVPKDVPVSNNNEDVTPAYEELKHNVEKILNRAIEEKSSESGDYIEEIPADPTSTEKTKKILNEMKKILTSTEAPILNLFESLCLVPKDIPKPNNNNNENITPAYEELKHNVEEILNKNSEFGLAVVSSADEKSLESGDYIEIIPATEDKISNQTPTEETIKVTDESSEHITDVGHNNDNVKVAEISAAKSLNENINTNLEDSKKNLEDSKHSNTVENEKVSEPGVGQDILQIAAKLIEEEDRIMDLNEHMQTTNFGHQNEQIVRNESKNIQTEVTKSQTSTESENSKAKNENFEQNYGNILVTKTVEDFKIERNENQENIQPLVEIVSRNVVGGHSVASQHEIVTEMSITAYERLPNLAETIREINEETSTTTKKSNDSEAPKSDNQTAVNESQEVNEDFLIKFHTPTEFSAAGIKTDDSTISATETKIKDSTRNKQSETRSNLPLNNQMEATTFASTQPETIVNSSQFTTNPSINTEETTLNMPSKFEEELNMAVKTLEATTHHHFEQFQQNLKKAFKSFTEWEAEHMKQEETTPSDDMITVTGSLQEDNNTTEETTLQPSTHKENEEYTTTMEPIEQATPETTPETSSTEVPAEIPDLGVINEIFVDKYQENFQENSQITEASATMPNLAKIEEDQSTSAPLIALSTEIGNIPVTTMTPIDALTKIEADSSTSAPLIILNSEHIPETTMTPNVLTTMKTTSEENKISQEEISQLSTVETTASAEMTTTKNDMSEDHSAAVESDNIKIVTESQITTTESDGETTIVPLFARVQLQKDINSVSLVSYDNDSSEKEIVKENFENTNAAAAELNYNKTTQQQSNEEYIEQVHEVKDYNNDKTTTQNPSEETPQLIKKQEEMVQLSTPETFLQDMVTFIHNQKTTPFKPDEQSSQTQLPLTQASFMEEQQQQIESTTETNLQTQTTSTGVHDFKTKIGTETTTIINESITPTTEPEVYSTFIVEAETETTNTTPSPIQIEPETRSRALPPPKLEYLQNEDGVEVFYGYSIVKRN